jgi:hypothetical protein
MMILSMGMTGLIHAQDTTTTTTTVTKKEIIENPDGSYTVIEYPVGKEVVIDLTPYNLQGAKGLAKVMRTADGTTIAVDLSGLPADIKSYYVYAVDPTGAVTLLGPAMIENGMSKTTFTTSMNQFMLVLSPNEGLTTIATETPVVFRSAVPSGYGVVPVAVTSSGGAKQVATTTPVNSAYQVPMLNLPARKTSEIRFNFTGELSGVKGKAYIKPKKDGSTQIKMRFDDMKNAQSDTRFILWATSSDGKYTKVGQVINTGRRQEGEIRGEIAMTNFGLFVTVESVDVEQPSGAVYTVFTMP